MAPALSLYSREATTYLFGRERLSNGIFSVRTLPGSAPFSAHGSFGSRTTGSVPILPGSPGFGRVVGCGASLSLLVTGVARAFLR
jgi:hypothetical protein